MKHELRIPEITVITTYWLLTTYTYEYIIVMAGRYSCRTIVASSKL